MQFAALQQCLLARWAGFCKMFFRKQLELVQTGLFSGKALSLRFSSNFKEKLWLKLQKGTQRSRKIPLPSYFVVSC